jgi:hypothetical protein
LPRESGRPLSRWSAAEIVRSAIATRLVPAISASTITRWLREDRIKPWQHRSWQKPTDPRFLQKATAVLRLYEQAHVLGEHGAIVVCADEKTWVVPVTQYLSRRSRRAFWPWLTRVQHSTRQPLQSFYELGFPQGRSVLDPRSDTGLWRRNSRNSQRVTRDSMKAFRVRSTGG